MRDKVPRISKLIIISTVDAFSKYSSLHKTCFYTHWNMHIFFYDFANTRLRLNKKKSRVRVVKYAGLPLTPQSYYDNGLKYM